MIPLDFIKKLVRGNFDIVKLEIDTYEIIEYLYENPEVEEYVESRYKQISALQKFNLLNKSLTQAKDDFNATKHLLEKIFKHVPISGKEEVFSICVPNAETGEPEELDFS